MFKTVAFASALIAVVEAWGQDSYSSPHQRHGAIQAYGADNSNYGHQATKGHGYGNNEVKGADNHNSHRETGHQG